MTRAKKEKLIRLAQKEAEKAIKKGNPPFGAILTDNKGNIISKAHSTINTSNDPTAHAEINLVRKSGKKLKTIFFKDYHLFSNAHSCSMCISACIKAKIDNFHFGAPREKPSLDTNIHPYYNIVKKFGRDLMGLSPIKLPQATKKATARLLKKKKISTILS